MKKLNMKGFSHHFVMAAVVVGFAVVGTFMLVQSRAATPSEGGRGNKAGKCSVTASPNPVGSGTSTLKITYTNTGTVEFYPTKTEYQTWNPALSTGTAKSSTVTDSQTLKPGASRSISYGQKIDSRFKSVTLEERFSNPAFSCSVTIKR